METTFGIDVQWCQGEAGDDGAAGDGGQGHGGEKCAVDWGQADETVDD